VRDGLKPVHRRLLYAMRQLRLDPNSAFKKSARVVGDVIGQYHPHGDQSIYDALVRLAQEFAARYPLIEGQGNFGNIDGDNPAAMRYTEARLTEVAEALLAGIDENAVDFRPNYDGSTEEPVVLPGGFPNLLANGAAGIAVGMACSIPPHNAGELCDALLHLIKTPNARIDTLVDLVKGPDFPTGGVLVEPREAMLEAYKTGRGAFRLRARYVVEELPRGQYRIIVTEIPYQVQKGKLIERIAEIINAKKLPILEDVRDESADDVRIVLEPRTGNVPAELLMEQLFRQTDLEIRFPLNLNVLDKDNTPRVMDLREALQAFLDLPAGRDRAAAGDPRRLPDRLSQSRPADQDHPRGGRAQAQDDQGFQAKRPAGRGDPQHAPARAAPARGIRDQGRAQEAEWRAQGTASAAQGREAAVGEDLR
jgi:topoisomerase-4 subunit A